jgi:hypothetical protein
LERINRIGTDASDQATAWGELQLHGLFPKDFLTVLVRQTTQVVFTPSDPVYPFTSG